MSTPQQNFNRIVMSLHRPGFALFAGEFFISVEYDPKKDLYEAHFNPENCICFYTLTGIKIVLNDIIGCDLDWRMEGCGLDFESNMGITPQHFHYASSGDLLAISRHVEMLCNLLAHVKIPDHPLSEYFESNSFCQEST